MELICGYQYLLYLLLLIEPAGAEKRRHLTLQMPPRVRQRCAQDHPQVGQGLGRGESARLGQEKQSRDAEQDHRGATQDERLCEA